MRKLLGALLSVLLAVGLAVVLFGSPSQAATSKVAFKAGNGELVRAVKVYEREDAARARTWVCQTLIDRGDMKFPDDEYVQFTLWYKRCYQAGSYQKVKPLGTVTAYDMGRGQIACGSFARYQGVNANWYFWRPYTGESFNPPPYQVPCDQSGSNARAQDYGNTAPFLEFGPGYGSDRQPRWKIDVTLMLNNDFDKHKSHAQDFNP